MKISILFIKIFTLIFFINTLCFSLSAQSNSDELSSVKDTQVTNSNGSDSNYQIVEEEIKKISASRHIFIMTNNNNFLNKGDFITLLLNNNLVCRALVAKNADTLLGIKILKIYSVNLWNKLKPDQKVQVLKGDDSYFRNLKKDGNPKQDGVDVTTPEKIDENIVIDEEQGLSENGSRIIRTDNIIGGAVGQIHGLDVDGSSKNYLHYGVFWAYQVSDNFFGEIFFGQSTVSGFPSPDLDTKILNLTLKAKYTFQAPLDTYIQPYAGYQIKSAKCPNAGKTDNSGSRTQKQLDTEKELIDLTSENSVIFGVSVLKRLVPGWFVKADLGTDIINAGIALEF